MLAFFLDASRMVNVHRVRLDNGKEIVPMLSHLSYKYYYWKIYECFAIFFISDYLSTIKT